MYAERLRISIIFMMVKDIARTALRKFMEMIRNG